MAFLEVKETEVQSLPVKQSYAPKVAALRAQPPFGCTREDSGAVRLAFI
jgi:hypothetical protein